MHMTRSQKPSGGGKTLRDAVDQFLDVGESSGDMALAGFILQHCFPSGIRSVASIGMGSESEFLILNSLADHAGNFVFLNTNHGSRDRQRLSELTHLLEERGFNIRALIADLTLPGRWPSLISALAAGDVRILGLDAAWACSVPEFWSSLGNFIRSAERVVYVRGALDFEHPDKSIEFLRGMPIDHDIEVIAATRASVWFASKGSVASTMRNMLRRSSLFSDGGVPGTDVGNDEAAAVIVRFDAASSLVDAQGAFPRVLYRIGHETPPGIEFGIGWSTPEEDGCWTDGTEAQLVLTPPAGTTGVQRLHLVGNAWLPPDSAGQIVEFGVGNRPESWTQLCLNDGEIASATIDIGNENLVNGKVAVTLRVQQPGRPSDYGGTDSRLLGFKLRSVSLFT
jgi:hypothetical protein